MKRQAVDWEKIFARDVSDKRLLSKIQKTNTVAKQRMKIQGSNIAQVFKNTLTLKI